YCDVQLLRDSTHARHLLRFGLIEIKTKPVTFFFENYKGA
ncbi:HNH endonuclease, partial [Acinetobacter baumannii]